MRVGRVAVELMGAYTEQLSRARETLRLARNASSRLADLNGRDPAASAACPAAVGFDHLADTLDEQIRRFGPIGAAGRRARKLSDLVAVIEHAATIEHACDAVAAATQTLEQQMNAYTAHAASAKTRLAA